jgi:hypothetical protein
MQAFGDKSKCTRRKGVKVRILSQSAKSVGNRIRTGVKDFDFQQITNAMGCEGRGELVFWKDWKTLTICTIF